MLLLDGWMDGWMCQCEREVRIFIYAKHAFCITQMRSHACAHVSHVNQHTRWNCLPTDSLVIKPREHIFRISTLRLSNNLNLFIIFSAKRENRQLSIKCMQSRSMDKHSKRLHIIRLDSYSSEFDRASDIFLLNEIYVRVLSNTENEW